MIVKRNIIRILCFGDSNTRGFVPLSGGKQRYEADQRWTGLLQSALGDNYEIIEEGLDARTTNLDDPRPGFVGKNGLTYFVPCLDSHKPLNLVILMLGTPDLKALFNRTSDEISAGLEELVKQVIETKVLIVSPPILEETTDFAKTMFAGATGKSQELGTKYQALSIKYNCGFVSGADCEVDPHEGVHLTLKGHQMMFEKIYAYIQNLKI